MEYNNLSLTPSPSLNPSLKPPEKWKEKIAEMDSIDHLDFQVKLICDKTGCNNEAAYTLTFECEKCTASTQLMCESDRKFWVQQAKITNNAFNCLACRGLKTCRLVATKVLPSGE